MISYGVDVVVLKNEHTMYFYTFSICLHMILDMLGPHISQL